MHLSQAPATRLQRQVKFLSSERRVGCSLGKDACDCCASQWGRYNVLVGPYSLSDILVQLRRILHPHTPNS